MILHRIFCVIFLVIVQALSGCSSDFSQPFPMPLIPLSQEVKKVGGAPEIYLQEIKDLRESKVFLEHDNMKYQTHADIGPVAREALSKAFEKQGYKYSNTAKFIFKTDILKWHAKIEEGFLSIATAEAEVAMALFNRQGQKMYSGKYRGVATLESVIYNNDDIAEILGASMGAAILQLSHDQKLESLLTKK